jgi:hypothetical protein
MGGPKNFRPLIKGKIMDRHILTIGYNPRINCAERIIPGDPDESGTEEVTVIVNDSCDIEILETGRVIEASADDLHRASSQPWGELAGEVSSFFSSADIELTGAELAIVWSELMMEPLPVGTETMNLQLQQVADEEDGGEFENPDGLYSGNIFVRYQFDEDGECYGERVLVLVKA